MNKKIGSILFVVGLSIASIVSVNAYTKEGSCNGIECNAVLNMRSNNYFQAGTYSDDTMAHISVSLDGEGEWWADTDSKENSTIIYR